jgi:DNA-binding XRE family transcriptional regulator
MNLASVFSEARLKFDAQRQEQIELARQALELKMMQHDLAKTIGEIKAALAQLEADKAAPTPPKAATAAPEAKTKPVSKASSKTTTKIVSKATPKRRASPQSIAIDNLEHRLAAVSAKIAALARTK